MEKCKLIGYHSTFTEIANIKNNSKGKATDTFKHCYLECKTVCHSEKVGPFFIKLNIHLHHPEIQLLEIYPRELKLCVYTKSVHKCLWYQYRQLPKTWNNPNVPQ